MHVLGASTKVIPAIPGQRPSSSNSLAQSGASGQVRPHHRKSSAQRANRSIGFVRSTPERPTRWAFGACVGPCTWPVGPGYLNGWPFGPKRIEHGPMGRRFAIPGQRPIRSNSLAQSEAPGQVRASTTPIHRPNGPTIRLLAIDDLLVFFASPRLCVKNCDCNCFFDAMTQRRDDAMDRSCRGIPLESSANWPTMTCSVLLISFPGKKS